MGKKPHFHLFGVPVRIEPVFFVIIAVFGLSFPPPFIVTWILIATISVLVHEMGHALAFKSFGIQPSVVLYGMGGLTSGSGRLTPGRSIVVSLAGPLSTLVLFGLPALWLSRTSSTLSADAELVLSQVIFINVGWAVLNLLPILPLDGGNVCASVLDVFTGGRGRKPAAVISIVLAGLVALWGFFTPGMLFVGFLGVMFAGMNVAALTRDQKAGLDEDLAEAHRALVAQQPHLAERHARDVLAHRPSPATATWARELLGWSRLWQGDLVGAQQAVQPPSAGAPLGGSAPPTPAGPSQAFQAAVAMAAGHRDQGLAVLTWSLANEQPGPSQLLGVMAAARLGLTDALVGELLALGPDVGQRTGRVVVQLLDYAGFRAESLRAAHLVTASVPPPAAPGPAGTQAAPGWPPAAAEPSSGTWARPPGPAGTAGAWPAAPGPAGPQEPAAGPPGTPGWVAPPADRRPGAPGPW